MTTKGDERVTAQAQVSCRWRPDQRRNLPVQPSDRAPKPGYCIDRCISQPRSTTIRSEVRKRPWPCEKANRVDHRRKLIFCSDEISPGSAAVWPAKRFRCAHRRRMSYAGVTGPRFHTACPLYGHRPTHRANESLHRRLVADGRNSTWRASESPRSFPWPASIRRRRTPFLPTSRRNRNLNPSHASARQSPSGHHVPSQFGHFSRKKPFDPSRTEHEYALS
ncbi:hypothetical protein FHU13_005634 [Methylobacterium sp. R2-1]|nr:hypothetical protein [Methylobacterium sp. R2-1]